MFFKTKVYVGIDVGHYSVKVAVVAQNRHDVLDLLEVPVLEGREFLHDMPTDEQVARAITQAVTPWTTRARHQCTLAVAVRGDGAMGQLVDLPPLERKQVEVALEAASVRLLPFPRAEAAVSSVPVPAPAGASAGATSHFVLALRQSAVEGLGGILQRCGLVPEKAEIHVLPLVRSFAANHATPPGAVECLVRVASRMTTIVGLRDGHPLFVRCIRLAGADFTYGLQMAMQGTWREAEEARRELDATARVVAIEPALQRWLEQVRRSVEAVSLVREDLGRPSKLWLSGGNSRWRGLGSRLEEHVGLPVQVDGWERLKPPAGRTDASMGAFGVALGLCLG